MSEMIFDLCLFDFWIKHITFTVSFFFWKAKSAVLTLLVLMKNIYIILVENCLWAALEISSNTHTGNMEIWKMPTSPPERN